LSNEEQVNIFQSTSRAFVSKRVSKSIRVKLRSSSVIVVQVQLWRMSLRVIGTGGHEWELVSKMEKGGHLVWCKSISSLKLSIEKARKFEFKQFNPEILNLNDILEILKS
jgi:hypothetical protein